MISMFIFDGLELEGKLIDTNSIDRGCLLTLHLQSHQLGQHLNLLFQRRESRVVNLCLRAALSWLSATFCEGVLFVVLRRRFFAFGFVSFTSSKEEMNCRASERSCVARALRSAVGRKVAWFTALRQSEKLKFFIENEFEV
jgi:hypothetical protein